jgi:hypothetical protein
LTVREMVMLMSCSDDVTGEMVGASRQRR